MGHCHTWRLSCVLILIVGAGFLATASAAGKSRRKLTQLEPPLGAPFGAPSEAVDPGSFNSSFNAFAGSLVQPINAGCKGVQIDYEQLYVEMIPPVIDPANPANKNQPYKFYALLFISNLGTRDVKGWRIQVGWQNKAILAYAGGARLQGGARLPAPVDASSVLMGYPSSDLGNSLATAGNWTEIQTQVTLYGTTFGTMLTQEAMPLNLTLLNKGYTYDPSLTKSRGSNTRLTVCYQERDFNPTLDRTTYKIEAIMEEIEYIQTRLKDIQTTLMEVRGEH